MNIQTFRLVALTLFLSTLNPQLSTLFAQGSLTPPGAPTPTMKTLDQVEARTIINSANTPGDASNSFIISAPGSYYLTGNITGVASKRGINIAASDVTVNLNGFAIIGVASSLEGINVSGARTNISLRNGTVRGWGGDGINALSASNGQYQDLRLSANGLRGLNAGASSSVLNCTALSNSSSGITVGLGSTITGCTAQDNFQHGFSTDSGTTVNGCTAYANHQRGINVGDGCTVTDCTVRSNTTDGIATGFDCVVSRCTARRNDAAGINASTGNTVSECTASFNGVHGIVIASDCLVRHNNCRQNVRIQMFSAGIYASAGQNRIEDNNATGNYYPIDCPNPGNIVIRNTASSSGFGYSFDNGNTVGPIIVGTNPITSNNPWANFSY
jgi:parallel beta-helix repeat protein